MFVVHLRASAGALDSPSLVINMKIDITLFKSDKIPVKERKIIVLYGTTDIELKEPYKNMSTREIIKKQRKNKTIE